MLTRDIKFKKNNLWRIMRRTHSVHAHTLYKYTHKIHSYIICNKIKYKIYKYNMKLTTIVKH